MADIPGIIEGASDGAGLGHDFLRHIDRCRLLVHVIDCSGFEGRDPLEDFDTINAELSQYSELLAERPQIVVANKTDLLGDDRELLDRLRKHVEAQGYEFYEMCAVIHEGTRELMQVVAAKLQTLPPVITYEAEYVAPETLTASPENTVIRQYDDVWTVDGAWIDQIVAATNFDDYESRMFFDRKMREAGIFERLEAMGVKDGDTVCLGELEFEYAR